MLSRRLEAGGTQIVTPLQHLAVMVLNWNILDFTRYGILRLFFFASSTIFMMKCSSLFPAVSVSDF